MDAEQKSSTQQTLAFVQVVVAGIWRRRNWLLAGAALGAALGAFRAVTTANQYFSGGKLYVRPGIRDVIVPEAAFSDVGEGVSRLSSTREAILNELQVLQSPALFELAVAKIGVDTVLAPFQPETPGDSAPWYRQALHGFQSWWFSAVASPGAAENDFERAQIAAKLLQRGVVIVPEAGASVISIFYFSHSPQHAQLIVNGLLEAATEMHGRVFDTMSGVEKVEEESATIEAQARTAETALAEFRHKHGIFDYVSQHETLLTYVAELDRQADTIEVAIGQRRAERKALTGLLETVPKERVAPQSLTSAINPTYTSLNAQLGYLLQAQITLEFERSVSLSGETLRQLRERVATQIADLSERLAQEDVQIQLNGFLEPNPEYLRIASRATDLDVELRGLETQQKEIEALRSSRRERLEQLEGLAPQFRRLELDARQKRGAADRVAEGVTNLRAVRRLEELRLSNVGVLQRGTFEPERQKPKRSQLVALGGVAGVFGAVLLAGFLALRDRRLRVAADLVRCGVPAEHLLRSGDGAPRNVVAATTLPSALAELHGDVAMLWSELTYDRRSRTGLSIAFVPCRGADASRAAAAMAVGLAVYGGERTAYLACRPEPTWLSGRVPMQAGRSWRTVLAADADVAGGAVTTPIANLDYFPLGEADVLQAHPMAGPAFISLLDRLTKAYRFVVIELPELHAWPEGRSALAAVDGAHVVARLDASERAHVVDTIAAIHHAGARLLGGIVQDAAAS
jgi:uncharacterized protein involved in exopolysaccharide biosynthesis